MFKSLYVFLLLALASMLAAGDGLAADEHGDLLHTQLARKVLAEDAQLAPANVGVIVKHRVAVLWGPVPSAVLAQRASKIIKERAEFIEVRNELVVAPDDDPWLQAAVAKPAINDHAAPRSSGVLAGRVENEEPPTLSPPTPVPAKPLRELVRDVQASRALYQSFAFTIEGSTIFVTAPLERGEVVQDFLQTLARLPGVERVVLKSN